jgi:hypothetical protein
VIAAPTTEDVDETTTQDPEIGNATHDSNEQYYECARKPANLVKDGYQRAMTALERETTYRWAIGTLHLETVPLFFRATFTAAEYDSLVEYHKQHLLYRLYIELPIGFMLPKVDANRHFWHQLTKGALNTKSAAAKTTVQDLFKDQHTTTCEAKSQLVTLTFVTPALRTKWKNRVLPFSTNKTKVTLKASDTLSSKDPKIGYDQGALNLLYQVKILHQHLLTQRQMRAIAKAAAGVDSLLVQEDPPVASPFAPHFWTLIYDQLGCPPGLVDVRRIVVKEDEKTTTMLVHHPRSVFKFPCASCLSLKHPTNECKTEDKEASLKKFTQGGDDLIAGRK